MADFEPVLLRRILKHASPSLDAYRADGGYSAATKALNEMTPAQVVDAVKASGLRGRGGAGFPCGLKWTFLPKDHPGPIYLCVNADESEPCTFNNRILMEEDPHQVLEGIILACYATRATTAYLYIRYEYGHALSRPAEGHRRAVRRRSARQEHPRQGLQSRHLPASRRRRLHLRRRDGADRKPGRQARLAADQAAVSRRRRGVPQADGRQQHRDAGLRHAHHRPRAPTGSSRSACRPIPKNPRDAGSYGPKLYCISGHVNKPGCVELPLGVTVRELVDKHGGGVWKGRKAKGCIPGGISMGLMTESRVRHAARLQRPGQGRLPRPGHRGGHGLRRNRPASSTCCTTSAASSPTSRAASVRRAAKGPAGC